MTTNWRDVVRDATRTPPPGARERVWRALQEPKSQVHRWTWLAVPVLAAVALALFIAWPSAESKTWATSGSVVALRSARVAFDPVKNRLELKEGTVAASVWASPALELVVNGHRVEVEAAELVVRAAGDSVVIAPTAGWVLVDGVRVDATDATRAQGAEDAAALTPHLPTDVANRQASRRAELALEAHRWEDAATALDEVGHSGTLAAEAAVLRKGELELRQLKNAPRALATFEDAAARFPTGSLGQERELSALEAEVALERWAAAVERAERFLQQYPASERQSDVRLLHVGALLRLGHRDAACDSVRGLPEGLRVRFARACE